ncbi:MAG: LamG domain-containing protein [Minisyncoccota bacterium]
MQHERHAAAAVSTKRGASIFFALSVSIVALATLALLPTTPARAATTINATLSMPPNNLGLVGWWTFDGGNISGTTVVDSSGTGNNAALVNGPTPAIGKLGQAFSFNGTNQYVNAGDPANGSLDFGSGQSFSLSFWFKTNDDATNQSWPGFISKEDSNVSPRTGYNCYLSSSQGTYNKLGCETFVSGTQDAVISSMTVNDNVWHHAVFVRDVSGSSMKLYVDGALNNSSALSSTGSTSNSVNLVFALRNVGSPPSSVFLQTTLDDVRIFNRALSASEVTQMYNAGSGSHINVSINPPNLANGLVGWWTFDGANMVSNVADTSGQGNNGNLVGYTSTTTTPGPVGQALSFNGTSNYVSITTGNTNFTGALTVSAWIRPTTAGGEIASKCLNNGATYNPFDFSATNINGSNVLYSVRASSSDYSAFWGGAWTPGVWQHVVVVYADGNVATSPIYYVNGTPSSATTLHGSTGTVLGSDKPILIGSRDDTKGSSGFNGAIDDVRIYSRALSAQEVQQLYNLSRTTLKTPR